ncbi:hypothetical protein AMTRI_Chr05g57180 [Amborella trichopoda]|uniref:Acyl-coenzyme A thioesterase 13 n=1 Tax=Amborella trichopoda TaxID=13333 RepID=W1NSH4_AMBTC|nr:acyl-coenzyme A thioesterase 13 [Amborella trichopoda]ERM98643.1 hypothetical protein AMTR_s00109p00100310 [Amborella trichopoda]|eukprot:XP_006833365.1 acyl-coenzyme A thioesterase 13 [Amborella trichopoda]
MERPVQMAQEWLEGLGADQSGSAYDPAKPKRNEFERFSLAGLRVSRAEPGRIICHLTVPKRLADEKGKWHAGAIAAMIDNVGAASIKSCDLPIKVSVDYNISYISTAEIGEVMEIEGKVLGHKGKLSGVMVEVRRKGNGEVVAQGRQWMKATSRL